MKSVVRELSGKDRTLLTLFEEARHEGPDGDAGRELSGRILPEVLAGLCRTFPRHVSGEALGLAWLRMQQPAFVDSLKPTAWLRFTVRQDLLSVVASLKEEVSTEHPELWESPDRVERHKGAAGLVFEELEELLHQDAGWPEDIAAKAVFDIEVRLQQDMFNPKQIQREMTYVPAALRRKLLAFISDPEGYVVGRLLGTPAADLRHRPAIQTHVSALGVARSNA
ncbi:hypothetical protein ANMWB30_22970 [Arthrobacter sp. MWB30]|nr:hypothetical protein ANMWB30_22970 [Arthrobacter sp. MWB30]